MFSKRGGVSEEKKIQQLVDDFAANVIAQHEAIWRGNARVGNCHANRTLRCFDKLYRYGPAGKDGLATLFTHNNPLVRGTAAVFLLKYKTEEAMAILEELATGEGFSAFCASEAIKRWNEGAWDLEPK
jgi:hypothetical protein